MNAVFELGSSAPNNGWERAMPDTRHGLRKRPPALPPPKMGSGIPKIDIVDENAVCEHYLRRLNRAWMHRIKSSYRKREIELKSRPSPQSFRKLDARSPSVPSLTTESGPDKRYRRRHRPSIDNEGFQAPKEDIERGGFRPKSAPGLANTPAAAWADLRDRNHAATGPGPTSSRRRLYHGAHRENSRPDSAPALRHHPLGGGVLSSRGHYNTKQHASAWLPPRVSRLERETQDLLTACRKAARDRGDADRPNYQDIRYGQATGNPLKPGKPPAPGHSRGRRRSDRAHSTEYEPLGTFWSDENIEDLGRGAVIRLIGNLGMGRYAHRFRAFAVTGSDLVSCTEYDLAQIGVSFRPHRIRLLKEIQRRKERREGQHSSSQGKQDAHAVGSRTLDELEPSYTVNHDDFLSKKSSILGSEHELTQSSLNHPNGDTKPNSLFETFSAGTAGDFLSTTATRTAYKNVAPGMQELRSPGGESPSIQSKASENPCSPSGGGSMVAKVSESVKKKKVGSCRQLGEARAGHLLAGEKPVEDGQTSMLKGLPGKISSTPITASPDAAAEKTTNKPRLRGPLQVSGARFGDVRELLGGSKPFLRIRALDELRRNAGLEVKGGQASWSGDVLSFSITDQALRLGGVQIKLCGADTDVPDHLTSAKIPGDITLELICNLHSKDIHGYGPANDCGNSDKPADFCAAGSKSAAVECRLLANAGGEDVGVCIVNLDFKADQDEPTETDSESRQWEPLTLDLPDVESKKIIKKAVRVGADAAEAATEVANKNQLDISILEGIPQHIQAIEEVCQLGRRQHEQARQLSGSKDEWYLSTVTHTEPVAKTHDREVSLAEGPPPFEDLISRVQRDAAIVIQSHTRRRTARKIAERRVQERAAANRVQAFVRKQMAAGEFCKPRGSEIIFEKQRSDAAIRLQSSSRRRLAVKTAHRLRKEEEWRAINTKRSTAAVHIQRFSRRVSKEYSEGKRKYIAATKLQRVARIRGAKADARRRKAERLRAKKLPNEAAAALRIQKCVRRQKISCASSLSQADEERIAAVRIQSITRGFRGKSNANLRRKKHNLDEERHTNEAAAALKIQRFTRRHRISYELSLARAEDERKAMVRGQSIAKGIKSKSETDLRHKEERLDSERCTDEAATALKIQIFTQRQTKTYERSLAQAEEERQAAVRVQSIARGRKGKCKADLRRKEQILVKIIAKAMFTEAWNQGKENSVAFIVEDRRKAAIKLQKIARARAATVTKAKLKIEKVDVEKRTVAAQKLQGFCRQRLSSQKVRAASHGSLLKIDGRNSKAVEKERQREFEIQISRKTSEAPQEVDSLVQTVRVELPGKVDTVVVSSDEKVEAARRVQSLCYQQVTRDRVTADCRARFADSPSITSVGCTSRATQELMLPTKENEAAVRIQRTYRYWFFARQTKALFIAKASELTEKGKEHRQDEHGSFFRKEATMFILSVFKIAVARKKGAALKPQREVDKQYLSKQEIVTEKRKEAAKQIQSAFRFTGARKKVAASRRQGKSDRQESDKQKADVIISRRRDAATCIQRAVRMRLAVERIAAIRWQRQRGIRRQKELEGEIQAMARLKVAECIEQVVWARQAANLTATLKRQRSIDNENNLENAFFNEQQQAVTCIQCAVRNKQAGDRVNELRQQREIEAQDHLQLERGREMRGKKTKVEFDAATCIQRASRCCQANKQAVALKQQRDVNNQHDREVDMEKVRVDTATCIQRAVRRRQVFLRVAGLRRQRIVADGLEEAKMEQENAAEREAAECMQRAVRIIQAVERISTLRREKNIEIARNLELEKTKRQVREKEAAVCIQRQARGYQDVKRVVSLKHQRDTDLRKGEVEVTLELEQQTLSERDTIAGAIQRHQVQRTAVGHLEATRGDCARQGNGTQQEIRVKRESESVSAVFNKMVAAARGATTAGGLETDLGVRSASSPFVIPEQLPAARAIEPSVCPLYEEPLTSDFDRASDGAYGNDRTDEDSFDTSFSNMTDKNAFDVPFSDAYGESAGKDAFDSVSYDIYRDESADKGKPEGGEADESDKGKENHVPKDSHIPPMDSLAPPGPSAEIGSEIVVDFQSMQIPSGEDGETLEEQKEAQGDMSFLPISAVTEAPEEEQFQRQNETHPSYDSSYPGIVPVDTPVSDGNKEVGRPQLEFPVPSENDNIVVNGASDQSRSSSRDEDVHPGIEHIPEGQELMEGWETHLDGGRGGVYYYYHPESGGTSWTLPHSVVDQPKEIPWKVAEGLAETTCIETNVSSTAANGGNSKLGLINVSAASDGEDNADQPEEWHEVLDPDTGFKYFYNLLTRQSAWNLPEGAMAAIAVAAAVAEGASYSEPGNVTATDREGGPAIDASGTA